MNKYKPITDINNKYTPEIYTKYSMKYTRVKKYVKLNIRKN